MSEFATYDVKNMMPVARILWPDGGCYAPIIGPRGHVDGMTKFGLFVFAPPKKPLTGATTNGRTACDQPVANGSFSLIR